MRVRKGSGSARVTGDIGSQPTKMDRLTPNRATGFHAITALDPPMLRGPFLTSDRYASPKLPFSLGLIPGTGDVWLQKVIEHVGDIFDMLGNDMADLAFALHLPGHA